MENEIIDQRYRLIAPIGSGGEARVFQALDRLTNDEVAVRVAPRREGDRSDVAPSKAHQGWVRWLNAGSDTTYGDYQVFELLRGETLRQKITRLPLTVNEWREFVLQSLAAVEALHQDGWVHGDLNADNFFHSASGWKLLELPFHRHKAPPGRSSMFGSIHTLAPEQFDGKQADARSDLYALGCLYYYAAAGAYPHLGASAVEVTIHRLRFETEPLQDKIPTLPTAWADAIMRLLARQPEDRVPGAAAARRLLGIA